MHGPALQAHLAAHTLLRAHIHGALVEAHGFSMQPHRSSSHFNPRSI